MTDKEDGVDAKIKKVEAIEKKIKFVAFGKTKPSTKKFQDSRKCKDCRLLRCNPSTEGSSKVTDISKYLETKCNTCRTQDEKDNDLLKRQADRLESAINKIKENKLGRAGSVYKMKDEIAGHKKAKEEATAIRDPVTDELIVSKDMIKKVTLEYVVKNLEGNIPDKEVRDMVKLRRDIQLENMKDTSGESFEIDEDDFNNVLAKFKSKTTKTYDFLLKAGTKYQSAIFELCKMMIEKEQFPQSFKQTVFI